MLLFLDESYENHETSGVRFAYAGFAIDERKYRGLVAAVYQAKQHYISQQVSTMDDATRIALARSTLLQDAPPERAEIKANKLMGKRQVERLQNHGFSPGLALATSMLEALQGAEATVFGVLDHPNDSQEILNPSGHLPITYIRLFERVEKWMNEQHPDEMVSIIPDTLDQFKHNLSACLADFLYRAKDGRAMRHIVVTPFWVDSSVTVGAQLADVIAYILMNSMRPETKRLPLLDQWRRVASMEFRSIDTVTRGIRKVRRT